MDPDPHLSSTRPYIDWESPFITDQQILAASLVTLGLPYKLRKSVNAHDTSKERVRYMFPRIVHIAQATPNAAPLQYNVHQLTTTLVNGDMETLCPEHPLCYAVQVILNRHALLEHTRKGKTLYCFRKGLGGITAMVNTPEAAGRATICEFFRPKNQNTKEIRKPTAFDVPAPVQAKWDNPFDTTHLLLAAALGTIGLPFKITTDLGEANFSFAEMALIPQSESKPVPFHTHQLIKLMETGELDETCPEHPLNYTLNALLNRASIVQRAKDSSPLWHFQRGSGGVAAMINDGDTKAFDTVTQFFKRSGRHNGKKNPLASSIKPKRDE